MQLLRSGNSVVLKKSTANCTKVHTMQNSASFVSYVKTIVWPDFIPRPFVNISSQKCELYHNFISKRKRLKGSNNRLGAKKNLCNIACKPASRFAVLTLSVVVKNPLFAVFIPLENSIKLLWCNSKSCLF